MTDLTAGDPTFILPVIFGISGLALIEVHTRIFNFLNSREEYLYGKIICIFQMNQLLYKEHETKFARHYRNFLRVLTVCFMGIAAYLPSVSYT